MRIAALTLQTITETATGAVELAFSSRRPLTHRAGQAGLLRVAGGGVKPFTFSSDDRSDRISVATTLASASRFKTALAGLRPGARATVIGAFGALPALDPTDPSEFHVFVAQGIGITPFLSMARSHQNLNATLLQVGTPHFFDEVAAATTAAEHYDHRDGLAAAVRQAITDHPTAQWSLSGRSDFVATVAAQLREHQVPGRRIHKDAFTGMRSAATSTTTGARPSLTLAASAATPAA